MKELNLNQMKMTKGGKLTMCEVGVIVGCGIAAGAMGIVSGGAGFLFGIYCSGMAAGFDACG